MYFFFFFQAEDGIRDYKVTGVQTCALPIWCAGASWASGSGRWSTRSIPAASAQRSEERRVGKSVDLGGRRIIKKKKTGSDTAEQTPLTTWNARLFSRKSLSQL